ncbi:T9SS type A sorting domain-containing protein [candidate division KSB1 bacterium]|nr:T9SS type A sorting domain-containing protein [candidate division KSB1 bacterium]
MKKFGLLSCIIMLLGMVSITFGQNHLLITEFSNRPNTPVNNEFVEIYNGTGATVDLTHYYLTDAPFQGDNDYVNIVDGKYTPFGFDFLAKFPDGAKIENGQFIIVALKGGDFKTTFGFDPNFELLSQSDTVPEMVAPGTDYIYSNTGFTDGSEVMILFYWDGASDLVQDVDYIVWGDTEEATCKTGVKRDGPDANTDSTTYFPDTPYASQILLKSLSSTRLHTDGKTIQRKSLAEVGETLTGGNGITGHDETSENLATAFMEADPTPGKAYSNTIKVTLQFNSATVLDTLGTNGFVEVRGALNNWTTGPVLPGGKKIDWNTSSDLDMVNVGGDYWTVTFEMNPDDTLRYKFWTGHTSEVGTYPNGGWEGPFNNTIADTRILITAQKDTLVPVQYYNPDLGLPPQPQYKMPFVPKPDTLAIYFRVNMGGEMEAERFNPKTNGPIGLRGDPGASAGVIDWGATKVLLKWEEKSVYDGSFWSGAAYFPKDSVTEGATQSFKFFAENTPNFSWEDGSDHKFTYPVGLKDTTIHWTWFSDKKIKGVKPIESIITWRLSTEALEALGLFNRGVGDEIEIRGPRGWGATEAVKLYYQPLLQEWTSANESFKLPPGTEIFYKYFINWDSTRFEATHPNYIPGLTNTDGSTRGWEEPAITGGGNRTHVFQNASEQTAVGDFGFERQFFNSVPANGVFNNDITVTWNVDMRNAANADSNAANASNLFRPGTDSVFVQWDGELLAVTQGQDMWGATRFVELKDPDGDMIYSGAYTIKVSPKFPNGWYQLGYKIAYSTSEAGVYIVNTGGGVEIGRRYMQYIHPDHIHAGTPWPQPVWPTSYSLPVVPWRDTNLFVEYPPPDLTKPTAVSSNEIGLPLDFVLEQNYPNPFNPTTTINYTMAQGARVSIKIYNVAGQLVATLIDAYQPQGHHFVKWLGKDASGKDVTSGLYLVKMVTGDFSQVNKMMLVR